jgi:hypothetical protein
LYIIYVYIKIFKIMDVLNFISWIKNGQQVTTVDPTQTLIPLGLKDPRRDDGYRSGSITAQNFINSVAPPAIVAVGTGAGSTVRTGLGNTAAGACGIVFGFQNTMASFTCHSVITGGFGHCSTNSFNVISGGQSNCNESQCSVISGGVSNYQGGLNSFIGGGFQNSMFGNWSAIVAGGQNVTSNTGQYGFTGGGLLNNVAGSCSSIIGGERNATSSSWSIVGGGFCNISCNTAARTGILGGQMNRATCNDSFVVGSCIITDRVCTTFVNNLSIINIPTSSAGLPSKSVWSNAGVLTIVP